MTKIMVLHEKHGDRYVACKPTIEAAAAAVVSARLREGWYGDSSEISAQAAAAAVRDGRAHGFMTRRRGCEYEGFDLADVPSLEEFT